MILGSQNYILLLSDLGFHNTAVAAVLRTNHREEVWGQVEQLGDYGLGSCERYKGFEPL